MIGQARVGIIARRGKGAKSIVKTPAAREMLTLVVYGLRDHPMHRRPASGQNLDLAGASRGGDVIRDEDELLFAALGDVGGRAEGRTGEEVARRDCART